MEVLREVGSQKGESHARSEVSILVLMEVLREAYHPPTEVSENPDLVSILVLMEVLREAGVLSRFPLLFFVSILVLMEVLREAKKDDGALVAGTEFQSLF